MKLAKVIGNVVSTSKDERLIGSKLLITQMLVPDTSGSMVASSNSDGIIVAVDMVGAGTGEVVLICSGSSAARATGSTGAPIDAVIIGIVDSADIDPREVV